MMLFYCNVLVMGIKKVRMDDGRKIEIEYHAERFNIVYTFKDDSLIKEDEKYFKSDGKILDNGKEFGSKVQNYLKTFLNDSKTLYEYKKMRIIVI